MAAQSTIDSSITGLLGRSLDLCSRPSIRTDQLRFATQVRRGAPTVRQPSHRAVLGLPTSATSLT